MIETESGLADLIERGGVYKDLEGTTSREVLGALMKAISPVSSGLSDKLLEAVLEREELMSTGMGGGIALPHPRNPLVTRDDEQFVSLAFLKEPVDWHSLDGEKVDTLLLIVSASAKQHLQTMSRITFFCRQEDFYRLLRERAQADELLRFIREAEKSWN